MAEVRSSEVTVAELIALVDRLEDLLELSALAELEVEVGGTALVLRTPAAVAGPALPAAAESLQAAGQGGTSEGHRGGPGVPATSGVAGMGGGGGLHAIVAPLTGVYYGSPSPGASAYVKEGGHVSAGQVIGLIEAMKLFNEIKSDVTGIVRRITVTGGALVKARQTLIEVEPA